MNDFQRVPERPSSGNGEQVDWYYRLGDRQRGPMTLAQLTELVAASGDVAREVVVKHHAEGAWVSYETIDAATARRLHADPSVRPASAPTVARGQDEVRANGVRNAAAAVKRSRNLLSLLSANRDLVVIAAVWVGVNFVLWFALDPLHRTERRYFQTLANAANQASDAQRLDAAERAKVAAVVAKEVKPIVEDLKKTASASEPIRQHLLWAAKDQLPKLFSANGKERGECDAIFQRHMYEAGRRLGIDVPRPQTSVKFE